MRVLASRWLAVCLALLLGLGALTASANITLVRFEAMPQPDGSIRVEWETASEFGTIGFRLYRATAAAGPPWDLIDEQPARGSGVSGAVYEYRDTDVVPGMRYYYFLEELTPSGPGDTAGPISAIAGWFISYLPLISR